MKRILVSAVIVVGALGLAGCSMGGASAPDSGVSEVAPFQGAPADGGANDGANKSSMVAPDAAATRKVVTNGYVTLTVDRPAKVADEAVQIVEAAGGRVDARTEEAPADDDRGSAHLTVRIPAPKLTTTLAELKKLGTVAQVSITDQDVTADARDLDARISALRVSTARLIDLMGRAATTAELVSIESALTQRQADLEQLETQKRSLDDQVSLATIAVNLQSVAVAPREVPNDFFGGLVAGWNAFVGFLSGLLVVFGVLLPWLVFLGLLTAAVLLIVRLLKRRSRPAA